MDISTLRILIFWIVSMTTVSLGDDNCPKECLCAGVPPPNLQFVCTFGYLSSNLNFTHIQNPRLLYLHIKCRGDILKGMLHDYSFSGMPNLVELVIESCIIKAIGPLTFEGLGKLVHLKLFSIGWDHGSPDFAPGWSGPLKTLMYLNVSKSKVKGFSEGEFCGLNDLRSIDFSMNRISHTKDIGIVCVHRSSNNDNFTEKVEHETNNSDTKLAAQNMKKGPPLQQLVLSSNNIGGLDIDLQLHAPKLIFLWVDNNKLESVNQDVSHIFNLGLLGLSLRNNRMKSILPSNQTDLAGMMELDLSNNSLRQLPDGFFTTVVNLQVLNLSANSLSEADIESSGIASSQNLVSLDLSKNPLRVLHRTLIASLTKLQFLDVSHCSLVSLELGALSRLKQLQTLKVNNNHLTLTRNLSLYNFKLLTILDLSHNPFTDLQLFSGLPILSELYLMHTNLSKFPSFLGQWNNLVVLDAGGNNIQNLISSNFRNLWSLKGLRLSRNNLTTIGGNTFQNLTQLTVLNLKENYIHSIEFSAFQGLQNLLYLLLDHNYITNVDVYLTPLTSLIHLSLKNNKLTEVPSDMLPNSLQIIDFSFNEIKIISSGAFHEMPHLRAVDLSYNYITTISQSALRMSGQAWPRPQFFLRGNFMTCDCQLVWLRGINRYSKNPFYNAPLVPDLEIVGCAERLGSGFWLTEVSDSHLLCSYPTHCNQLKCDCCGNILEPEQCSCRAFCLQECTCLRTLDFNRNIMDCTGQNVSASSLKVRNRPLDINDLRLDNITLEVIEADFFDYVHLEYLYLNNSMVKVILPSAFERLPAIKILYLQDNEVTHLNGETFGNLSTLQELYLERNYISEIASETFSQLSSLKILNLCDNRLKGISLDVFSVVSSLQRLTLYNNPFECDCTYGPEFKYFLSANANNIHRVQDITCFHDPQKNNRSEDLKLEPHFSQNEQRLTDISGYQNISGQNYENISVIEEPVIKIDFSYCQEPQVHEVVSQEDVTFWLILVSVIFITIVIICVAAYKNRFLIQVFMYNKFGCFGRHDDDNDVIKPYDVYVACAEDDEEFMFEEIVPKLEEGVSSYKLCLESRDWPVGEFKMDSIIAAIQQSKRTLVLVTPNYFKSEWCQFVFKTAHYQVLLEKRMLLVLVVLDKALMRQMDADMRLYMRTKVYLTYNVMLFWDKLKYYLPARPRGGAAGEGRDVGMRGYTLLNVDGVYPRPERPV